MKPVVIIFILLELLDYLTTKLGLSLGMVELNPLFLNDKLLLLKLLVTATVSICLQRIQNNRIKVVTIPVWIAVIWNLINILPYYFIPI